MECQGGGSPSSESCSTTEVNSDSDLELPVLPQQSNIKTTTTSSVLLRATSCNPAKANFAESKNEPYQSCSSSTEVNSDSDLEFVGVEESRKLSLNMKPRVDDSEDEDDDDCLVVHMDLSGGRKPEDNGDSEGNCESLDSNPVPSFLPLRERLRLHLSDDMCPHNPGMASDFDELPEIEPSDSETVQLQTDDASSVDAPDHSNDLNDAPGSSNDTEDVYDCSKDQKNVPDSSNDMNNKRGDEMKKGRKKRSPAEIAESKRLAEERRAQRRREQEQKKASREKEMRLKKAAQENKRCYRPGECVKFITVCADPGVVNCEGLGAAIFKTCVDADIRCVTEQQTVPNTIVWKREILDCSAIHQQTAQQPKKVDVVEDEVLAMIHLSEFISLVHAYISCQRGAGMGTGLTLREHVTSLQSALPHKTLTFFVVGLEAYLRGKTLSSKQQHREAVLALSGQEGPSKAKQPRRQGPQLNVTSTEIEEALVDTQLHTDCVVQLLSSNQEVADLVRTFSKAVAEKPAKKDRLQSAFCFLEEGVAGVKVDKSGQGLLKVWKSQLLQFKSLGPEMAEAIVAAYPSPRLLVEAYRTCSTQREAERLLADIMVRRGAGVLVTNRRIGKELSRRIHSFFTSLEPEFVLK